MFNYKYIIDKYELTKKLFRINQYLEIKIWYKIKSFKK